MSGIVIGALAGLMAAGAAASWRESRRNRASRALVQQIRAEQRPLACFYSGGGKFEVSAINDPAKAAPARPYVVSVAPEIIGVYPFPPDSAPAFTFAPGELRWFGRPKKYSYQRNAIWLHIERGGQWYWLRLHLYREQMRLLVRALKTVATPQQVTAYRRRRPYIHHGPLSARPASQDMLGAWTLGPAVPLYLMPLFLVILDGAQVRRTLPLDAIQKIGAIRRLDQPGAAGLVRFEAQGEPFAYALAGHEEFAAALAEAAKRTLEDPVQWQRKKKKDCAWIEAEDEEEE